MHFRNQKEQRSLNNEDTWILIPLFNEGEVVGDVLAHVKSSFSNIVCVDDCSDDDSVAIALNSGAIVLEHPVNLGQGAALQTALEFALQDENAKFFVTFDSDGQHQVEDALAMVQRLRIEPVDIIVGSRFLDTRTELGRLKKIVLRLAVLFETLTTGVKLTDAHNGLRAMNRNAALSVQITQNRMAHASEIVAEIGKRQLRFSEHPVHIVYTDYSKAKGQSLWNSINILKELFIR